MIVGQFSSPFLITTCASIGAFCGFRGLMIGGDVYHIGRKRGRSDYRTGMVSVAGVFRTHADVGAAGLNPVYKLDCSFFDVAKTSY